jgi:hypothetical protein
MALQINELSEADFDAGDIDSYLKRSSLADIISAGFVTDATLMAFPEKSGSFVHDGTVFDIEVDSLKHALEYTHSRTAIVHNGFENFVAGLNEDTPIFFAHIASRSGGLASIECVIQQGSVGIGESFGVLETFTIAENEFNRGSEYIASALDKVSIGGVEYDLPMGKFGKSVPKNQTSEYPGGSILIIEAKPLSGYQFLKWEGEDTSEYPMLNLELDNNLYIEATFTDE